jgi:hypothetical protein
MKTRRKGYRRIVEILRDPPRLAAAPCRLESDAGLVIRQA